MASRIKLDQIPPLPPSLARFFHWPVNVDSRSEGVGSRDTCPPPPPPPPLFLLHATRSQNSYLTIPQWFVLQYCSQKSIVSNVTTVFVMSTSNCTSFLYWFRVGVFHFSSFFNFISISSSCLWTNIVLRWLASFFNLFETLVKEMAVVLILFNIYSVFLYITIHFIVQCREIPTSAVSSSCRDIWCRLTLMWVTAMRTVTLTLGSIMIKVLW